MVFVSAYQVVHKVLTLSKSTSASLAAHKICESKEERNSSERHECLQAKATQYQCRPQILMMLTIQLAMLTRASLQISMLVDKIGNFDPQEIWSASCWLVLELNDDFHLGSFVVQDKPCQLKRLPLLLPLSQPKHETQPLPICQVLIMEWFH